MKSLTRKIYEQPWYKANKTIDKNVDEYLICQVNYYVKSSFYFQVLDQVWNQLDEKLKKS